MPRRAVVATPQAQEVFSLEQWGEVAVSSAISLQRAIGTFAQFSAWRRIPIASRKFRLRQRRACDLRPRTFSKRSWMASSGPWTSMPVAPSASFLNPLGFFASQIPGLACRVGSVCDASHADEHCERTGEPYRSQGGRMTILETRSLADQAECEFHMTACTSNTLKRVCRSTLTAETYQMELGVEAADQLRAVIADMFEPFVKETVGN